MRYILHSDLNNFYASVECLYNPSIRNLPVVVAGDESKRHGIVLSKNGIAKDMGVKTGEPLWQARQKAGNKLVVAPARFDEYVRISKMVKDIYRVYSSKVESFGIDEAWVDITHLANSFEEAERVANEIRVRVLDEIGITVSIGVSFNKVFAKLGSDLKKPNAVSVIKDTDYKDVVWPLKAEELIYVGKATRKKLNGANILTIGDLANADLSYLKAMIGQKHATTLYEFANGLENSEVKNNTEKEKSIGNSTTCPRDLKTDKEVYAVLYLLAESVARRMHEKNFWCQEVAVTIKNARLESVDRQIKLLSPINTAKALATHACELFKKHYDWDTTVRALGVRVGKLCDSPVEVQINMFDALQPQKTETNSNLDKAIESLRRRYGHDIIKRVNIASDYDFAKMNTDDDSHNIFRINFF